MTKRNSLPLPAQFFTAMCKLHVYAIDRCASIVGMTYALHYHGSVIDADIARRRVEDIEEALAELNVKLAEVKAALAIADNPQMVPTLKVVP